MAERAGEPGTCTVGVDLGGTKILGVVLDGASGTVLAEHKIPNPRTNADDIIDAFGALIESLTRDQPTVAGIGIGLAGLVDRSGVLRYGPNVPGVTDF